MAIEIGVNLEFIRSEDKPFEEGVRRAASLGFEYVEPLVHNGRELLSEAGYFHSFSMDNEPLEMRDILERNQVRASGLSAHCPLMRPEISVPYLEKAIRLAAAIGAPVVNTDEGIRPGWLTDTTGKIGLLKRSSSFSRSISLQVAAVLRPASAPAGGSSAAASKTRNGNNNNTARDRKPIPPVFLIQN